MRPKFRRSRFISETTREETIDIYRLHGIVILLPMTLYASGEVWVPGMACPASARATLVPFLVPKVDFARILLTIMNFFGGNFVTGFIVFYKGIS